MSKQSKRHMGLEVQGDLVTSNSLMFRNRIINGDMRIDQRNSGATFTPTSTNEGTYSLDRWHARISQASKISVGQSSIAPAGFSKSLVVTSLGAYSLLGTDHFAITQAIEGFNTEDLSFGSAEAKTISVSFWVRSSSTGTFGGFLANSLSDRCYVFSYTINSANTWEQKTISVPGDVTGTWLKDNGVGLFISFSVGAGSGVTGTAGSWGTYYRSVTGQTNLAGAGSSATFYLTGVQLEAGSSASAFERRPVGLELSLCQRYYEKSYDINVVPGTNTYVGRSVGSNYAYSTTAINGAPFFFKVTKRVAPSTYKFYAQSGQLDTWQVIGPGGSTLTGSASLNVTSETGVEISINGLSGLTIGTVYTCMGHWTADAEL